MCSFCHIAAVSPRKSEVLPGLRCSGNCGRLENRRAVLKLSFADRRSYKRNEGFRTADLSFPFKALT
ncbi:hypothetical protein B5K08_02040 [Rhizobium leguminosarum bv. trifolii]|uniref:Uncharacterized protein n=1 Tax=Rhizobium leguminosarum bv. trifolii TaxID=386 RepID=A0A3E1C047_RHILT|nr:hypothetical protein B5K08_02040 [Rhizobium leguminosarum bv. trifolii]RFC01123.1 hypothetical protein B5K10_02040 [Rhizobium leguminosarum bv. trifolii]